MDLILEMRLGLSIYTQVSRNQPKCPVCLAKPLQNQRGRPWTSHVGTAVLMMKFRLALSGSLPNRVDRMPKPSSPYTLLSTKQESAKQALFQGEALAVRAACIRMQDTFFPPIERNK